MFAAPGDFSALFKILLFIILHLFLLGFFFGQQSNSMCPMTNVADSQKYFLALVLNNVLH